MDTGMTSSARTTAAGARGAPSGRLAPVAEETLSLATRLWFAWLCFFRVLFDGAFAARVWSARDAPALPAPRRAARPRRRPRPRPRPRALRRSPSRRSSSSPSSSARAGSSTSSQQDIASFRDADVGAAARVVHEGCRKALRAHADARARARRGARARASTLAAGFDARRGEAHGRRRRAALRTRACCATAAGAPTTLELPELVGGHDARVLAPAEVELDERALRRRHRSRHDPLARSRSPPLDGDAARARRSLADPAARRAGARSRRGRSCRRSSTSRTRARARRRCRGTPSARFAVGEYARARGVDAPARVDRERQELALAIPASTAARAHPARSARPRTSRRSRRSRRRGATSSTSRRPGTRASAGATRRFAEAGRRRHGARVVRRGGARAHRRGGARRGHREPHAARGAAGRALRLDRSRMGDAWRKQVRRRRRRPRRRRRRRHHATSPRSPRVEKDGSLELVRVAVGDHILLGGDNMDLALAHVVAPEARGARARRSTAGSMARLVHACRVAKERLLGDAALDARAHRRRRRAARSCSAATLRTELTRDEVDAHARRRLLSRASPATRARRRARARRLTQLGLPYASGPGGHAAPRGVPRRQAGALAEARGLRAAAARRERAPQLLHPTARALQRRRDEGRRAARARSSRRSTRGSRADGAPPGARARGRRPRSRGRARRRVLRARAARPRPPHPRRHGARVLRRHRERGARRARASSRRSPRCASRRSAWRRARRPSCRRTSSASSSASRCASASSARACGARTAPATVLERLEGRTSSRSSRPSRSRCPPRAPRGRRRPGAPARRA